MHNIRSVSKTKVKKKETRFFQQYRFRFFVRTTVCSVLKSIFMFTLKFNLKNLGIKQAAFCLYFFVCSKEIVFNSSRVYFYLFQIFNPWSRKNGVEWRRKKVCTSSTKNGNLIALTQFLRFQFYNAKFLNIKLGKNKTGNYS